MCKSTMGEQAGADKHRPMCKSTMGEQVGRQGPTNTGPCARASSAKQRLRIWAHPGARNQSMHSGAYDNASRLCIHVLGLRACIQVLMTMHPGAGNELGTCILHKRRASGCVSGWRGRCEAKCCRMCRQAHCGMHCAGPCTCTHTHTCPHAHARMHAHAQHAHTQVPQHCPERARHAHKLHAVRALHTGLHQKAQRWATTVHDNVRRSTQLAWRAICPEESAAGLAA